MKKLWYAGIACALGLTACEYATEAHYLCVESVEKISCVIISHDAPYAPVLFAKNEDGYSPGFEAFRERVLRKGGRIALE